MRDDNVQGSIVWLFILAAVCGFQKSSVCTERLQSLSVTRSSIGTINTGLLVTWCLSAQNILDYRFNFKQEAHKTVL